jgi:2-isopropylmalate synthase
VLYIPIDPADIGRSYKAIIRINSQSGKGGVAYVLENDFGYQLPKLMHREIGRIINDLADAKGTELQSADIHEVFVREYLSPREPLHLEHCQTTERDGQVTCEAKIIFRGQSLRITGQGNGPIDAFSHALAGAGIPAFELLSYSEHSLGRGADTSAISYIQIKDSRGRTFFGAGTNTSIELASLKAIVSAINRALK